MPIRPALALVTAALVLNACAPIPGRESTARVFTADAVIQAERRESVFQAVDRAFAEYDNTHSPGCAVGVVRGGELVLTRGYGMASLEHDVRITPQTAFYAASVSKQFTAFAVALLADQGKLSLDDDIRRWIPEVPDFGATITVGHLLHHTSGLRDYFGLLALTGWPGDGRLTMAEVLDLTSRQRALNFPPGTQYLYSNTGYVLLAVLVERVSGQPLREFAKAEIFEPLGMSRTTFRDDHTMLIEDRALAYAPDAENGYRLNVPGFAVVGDGGLYTTVEDMGLWARNFDIPRVGGPRVAALMLNRGVLTSGDTIGYALGLGHGSGRGLRTIGHGGSYAGYRANFTHFPDQGVSVITLCNRSDAAPSRHSLRAAEAFLGEHMQPEEARAPTPAEGGRALVPPLVDRYEGGYRVEGVGSLVSFSRDADRLVAHEVHSSKSTPLVPLSAGVFRLEDASAHVVFESGTGEVPRRATWELANGGTYSMRRIEMWDPDARDLHEFVGRYYSPEVDTFYTVVLEDGRLVARHRRRSDLPLTPAERDGFGGGFPFLEVRFERGENGEITGFLVSAGRMNDIRFEKTG